jgi:hypothetical protein
MYKLMNDYELKNDGFVWLERLLDKNGDTDGFRVYGVDSLGKRINTEYSSINAATTEYYRLVNIHS